MGQSALLFHQLSPRARAELYRAAGNVRSCDSCVSWLPGTVNVAGRIRTEMHCEKSMPACRPDNGHVCDFYERAVGTDDA